MATATFDSDANFDITGASVDNNAKLLKSNNVSLNLWQDNFGSSLDSHWSKSTLRSFTESGSVSESGGECSISCTSASGFSAKAIESPAVFSDGTWIVKQDAGTTNNAYYYEWNFMVDSSNYIFFVWNANIYAVYKVVSGAQTLLVQSNHTSTEIDIKVVKSGTSWRFYRAIHSWLPDSWLEVGSGPYTVDIGEDSDMFIRGGYITNQGTAYDLDIDYFQCSGTSYYWDDSPEVLIITSGQTYTLDAGAGNYIDVSALSVSETEPAGTTLKYKYSFDSGTASWSDTWVDSTALETALKNNTSKDRYLHIKAQLNSDGTATPVLDDFELTYTTPAAAAIVDTEADSGTETLNDSNIGLRMIPQTTPCLLHFRLSLANLNNSSDDYTITVSSGTEDSEEIIDEINLTSDGSNITMVRNGMPKITLDVSSYMISNIFVNTGDAVLVEYTKNSSTEREASIKYNTTQYPGGG